MHQPDKTMESKPPSRAVHSFLAGLVLFSFVLIASGTPCAAGPVQEIAAKEAGLPEGATAPHFLLVDQFGKDQRDTSIAGKNGTVLLFFRSADW